MHRMPIPATRRTTSPLARVEAGGSDGMPVAAPRRRHRVGLSLLSLKFALVASLAVVVASLGLGLLFEPLSLAFVAALSVVVGLVSYAAAYRLLVRRLDLAGTTLRQIRRHQFDNLDAAHLPRGDELNGLILQVYRTGLALEKEIRELKKIENHRREFLGNVSHELKTPIFAVQGFAETLLDGALDDERVNRAFVEKILRNAARLNNLVRDLSEISRIETGDLKMSFAPFSVRRLAAEVTESLELVARSREVTLHSLVPEDLPPALGDRERIRQVLVNLVDNAIKYNNPGGEVEVSARLLPAGEIKVSVVDNGIGLAPQDIPRVTERFYRVDKSRSREQGGTGLGLAIVKHILHAHDRKLMVESHLGRGSTFGFSLPIARLPA
jgi:two-component system, OmpR family, phosphate regulon sensor histidine kinase PhoR